ncbi:hypothetical protein COCC4DRAFT_126752 [Bipolaris maydis ATCC 48331]|uniref:Uncharacterized protein n=2 Tax=Cochliobolus heterostrophus TaxID=5016 RepID=M2TVV8_COCH5|nr:uncharacterized protein COCC4DRAFT_126752 [Bipolaris maydis ATCC 48331]EMD90669.1 hypothetical protein COCHEDRAFT_1157668 [Bipolaris maydis C5]ENI09120.1 hypothetical protein COCC4DRAFT_126752 [Bipolaris maydis ATCC 48331]
MVHGLASFGKAYTLITSRLSFSLNFDPVWCWASLARIHSRMFTAVSRALHFSSESGASRPRDGRVYKHRKGSVLRVSYPGKIILGGNVILVKLKKSGLVVVLYRGGKSSGRSIWGCSGGEQKQKKNQTVGKKHMIVARQAVA